jgi:hypothetical protein
MSKMKQLIEDYCEFIYPGDDDNEDIQRAKDILFQSIIDGTISLEDIQKEYNNELANKITDNTSN